ncbi:uncharacterized protein LOC131942370 [Physella acuta]|uniref:uncharacterized protein LOC131942370 n=1 Tax=Physella acuta TaxID=109671 RepID=UPI0027DDD3C7|nr:uncharacterized protein LOC131942370 [Physella acuta]
MTNTSSVSPVVLDLDWFSALYATYLILILVIGFPGNIVIAVVYGKTFPKTACDWLILTMGITDAIVCLFSPLLHLRSEFEADFPWLNGFWCGLDLWMQYTAMVASLIILDVIAVDRYIKICQPTLRSLTPTKARHVCVWSCVLGAIFSFYPTLDNFREDVCNHSRLHVMSLATKGYYTGLFSIFLCSFIVVTFAYISVCKRIGEKVRIKKRLLSNSSPVRSPADVEQTKKEPRFFHSCCSSSVIDTLTKTENASLQEIESEFERKSEEKKTGSFSKISVWRPHLRGSENNRTNMLQIPVIDNRAKFIKSFSEEKPVRNVIVKLSSSPADLEKFDKNDNSNCDKNNSSTNGGIITTTTTSTSTQTRLLKRFSLPVLTPYSRSHKTNGCRDGVSATDAASPTTRSNRSSQCSFSSNIFLRPSLTHTTSDARQKRINYSSAMSGPRASELSTGSLDTATHTEDCCARMRTGPDGAPRSLKEIPSLTVTEVAGNTACEHQTDKHADNQTDNYKHNHSNNYTSNLKEVFGDATPTHQKHKPHFYLLNHETFSGRKKQIIHPKQNLGVKPNSVSFKHVSLCIFPLSRNTSFHERNSQNPTYFIDDYGRLNSGVVSSSLMRKSKSYSHIDERHSSIMTSPNHLIENDHWGVYKKSDSLLSGTPTSDTYPRLRQDKQSDLSNQSHIYLKADDRLDPQSAGQVSANLIHERQGRISNLSETDQLCNPGMRSQHHGTPNHMHIRSISPLLIRTPSSFEDDVFEDSNDAPRLPCSPQESPLKNPTPIPKDQSAPNESTGLLRDDANTSFLRAPPQYRQTLISTGSITSTESTKFLAYKHQQRFDSVDDGVERDEAPIGDVPTAIFLSTLLRRTDKGSKTSKGSGKSASSRRRFGREKQMTLMLLSVTAAFLLSWIPPWVLYMFSFYGSRDSLDPLLDHVLFKHLATLNLVNFVANPIIYYCFNPSFRSKVKTLLLPVSKTSLCFQKR